MRHVMPKKKKLHEKKAPAEKVKKKEASLVEKRRGTKKIEA